ncbi:ribonuclease H-like domain-containing protein [Tanacetum coccineum]
MTTLAPCPQLQMTFNHNHSVLKIQDHNNEPSSSKLIPNVSPPADTTESLQQELDFLFSPLFKEYFTAGNQSVSVSSALSDNSTQQATQPTTNVQPTTEPITLTKTIHAGKKTLIKQLMHSLYHMNFSILSVHRKRFMLLSQMGSLIHDIQKRLISKRKLYRRLSKLQEAWYDKLSNFLMSKGFTKGLQIHQSPRGIFINQAKYALEILKKHGMDKCDSIGTPMATKPKLDEDLSGVPVDQTRYCSMIGHPCWYRQDSGFELTAFLDVDHAGCLDTRKITSGGI